MTRIVATPAEIRELQEESSHLGLVLPLEAQVWTKDEIRLFFASDGTIRPTKWCSVPDQKSLANKDMSEADIEASLRQAASWILEADALLVGSGAGMGVESGLATFRGGRGGVWPALQPLGLAYEDICHPKWFKENPRLAWGFWLFCHRAYQKAEPHLGYGIVKAWAERAALGGYAFTSNIDGHWQLSGWPADKLLEVHGRVHWLQCSAPCCDDVFEAPEDLGLEEDPESHEVVGELPVCPKCGAVARPCVQMFGNDSAFSKSWRQVQQLTYDQWRSWAKTLCAVGPNYRIVCLELGCGMTVPTVRKELEKFVREDFEHCRLVRVNPENHGVSADLLNVTACLPFGALEALQRLDVLMGEQPLCRFIVHDTDGNGAEVVMPPTTPVDRVVLKAESELGWEVTKLDDQDLSVMVSDIGRISMDGDYEHVNLREAIPNKWIFSMTNDSDLPAVKLRVQNEKFSGRNRAYEESIERAVSLIDAVLERCRRKSYQERLERVTNRKALNDLMAEAHLDVLPQHGFQLSSESTLDEVRKAQLKMTSIICSASSSPEVGQRLWDILVSTGMAKSWFLPAKEGG